MTTLKPAKGPQLDLVLAVTRFIATGEHIGEGILDEVDDTTCLRIPVSNKSLDLEDFEKLKARLAEMGEHHRLQHHSHVNGFELYTLNIETINVNTFAHKLAQSGGPLGYGTRNHLVDRFLNVLTQPRTNGNQLEPHPPGPHPALQILTRQTKPYPMLWRDIDLARENWQEAKPLPDNVYILGRTTLALAAKYHGNSIQAGLDGAIWQALASWRIGKVIIRFDQSLHDALIETPVADIPTAVLEHIPYLGLYIECEIPFELEADITIVGYFANLDVDAANQKALRLQCLLSDGELWMARLPLVVGSVEDALRKANEDAIDINRQHQHAYGDSIEERLKSLAATLPAMTRMMGAMLSLVLYVCSDEADLPAAPAVEIKKTKRGPRLFARDKPVVLEAGLRVGAALRRAIAQHESSEHANSGRTMMPHVRRAHYHTYRVGAGRTQIKIRWLAPILVNLNPDAETTAVIKPVHEPHPL
jgi:hypothetical protein